MHRTMLLLTILQPLKSLCRNHYAGFEYEGEWFEKNNCAVSILRSGKLLVVHVFHVVVGSLNVPLIY